MSSSDDEIIGAEAEQEYEASLPQEEVPQKKAKSPKLTTSQRLKLIDDYRHGKSDKFYNVVPIKGKPGEYRVIKRRTPLEVPVVDTVPSPEPIVTEAPPPAPQPAPEPVKKDKKLKQEFFAMQTTINNSLSKEIAAVMEKCNKIEAKMKKQKAKMKQQRLVHPQPVEEYEYDDEPEPQQYYDEPRYYPRFNARNRIDLRNFG